MLLGCIRTTFDMLLMAEANAKRIARSTHTHGCIVCIKSIGSAKAAHIRKSERKKNNNFSAQIAVLLCVAHAFLIATRFVQAMQKEIHRERVECGEMRWPSKNVVRLICASAHSPLSACHARARDAHAETKPICRRTHSQRATPNDDGVDVDGWDICVSRAHTTSTTTTTGRRHAAICPQQSTKRSHKFDSKTETNF